jgi:hypothetical protein
VNRDITAQQPRAWRREREQATQPRLLIVPVGSVTRSVVKEIADDVARSLSQKDRRFPIEIDRRAVPTPPGRHKWLDARPLLDRLDQLQRSDWRSVRVIGLTMAELCMPGLPQAMAPTRPGGAALVSLAHLGRDPDQVARLGRRLVLHALARSLRVPPSGDSACPSSPLYEPRDLAAKSARFTAAAESAFHARWDAEADAVAFAYPAAARKLSAIARREKDKALHAEAAYMGERALDGATATVAWRAYQELEQDAALKALVQRRIELLDRTQKWIAEKKLDAAPADGQQE